MFHFFPAVFTFYSLPPLHRFFSSPALSHWEARDKYLVNCHVIICINAFFWSFLCFTKRFGPLALSIRDSWKPVLLSHNLYLNCITHLKYKTMGLLDPAVLLFLFVERQSFSLSIQKKTICHHCGTDQANSSMLSQTHLPLNKADQKRGSISHTLKISFPVPLQINSIWLLLSLYLIPSSFCYPFLKSVSFFIPSYSALIFSFNGCKANCGGKLLWKRLRWLFGVPRGDVVYQTTCIIVCWQRALPCADVFLCLPVAQIWLAAFKA